MGTPSSLIFPALGLGDGSGLSVRESLRPLANGQRRRTINGKVRHTGRPEFELYALTISSDDVQPPALADLWPGTVCEGVVPVSELGAKIAPGEQLATLRRDPHPGSVRCRRADGVQIPYGVVGRTVMIDEPQEQLVRVFFRPVQTFVVMEPWSQDESETGKADSTSWSIELGEKQP